MDKQKAPYQHKNTVDSLIKQQLTKTIGDHLKWNYHQFIPFTGVKANLKQVEGIALCLKEEWDSKQAHIHLDGCSISVMLNLSPTTSKTEKQLTSDHSVLGLQSVSHQLAFCSSSTYWSVGLLRLSAKR